MKRLKKVLQSLALIFIAFIVVLSILFYHVSAVAVYERDQQEKFIRTASALWSIGGCTWISDTLISERVITLRCDGLTEGQRYLHFNEKIQLLGQISTDRIDFESAKTDFTALTGVTDIRIAVTYFNDQNVYLITSPTMEWIMDQNKAILWKVNKNYE